jgi:hypothetical protein
MEWIDDVVLVGANKKRQRDNAAASAHPVEILSLKLIEYLYPWMLVNHTPLQLVSRSIWEHWKKFFSCTLDTKQFSPWRLVNPLFDDRILFQRRKQQEQDEDGDGDEDGDSRKKAFVCLTETPECESTVDDDSDQQGNIMENDEETMEMLTMYNEPLLMKQHLNYLKDFCRHFVRECLHFTFTDTLSHNRPSGGTAEHAGISFPQRIALGRLLIHNFTQERALVHRLPTIFTEILRDEVIPQLFRKYPLHAFANAIHRLDQLSQQFSSSSPQQGQTSEFTLSHTLPYVQTIVQYLQTFYRHYQYIAKRLLDIFTANIHLHHVDASSASASELTHNMRWRLMWFGAGLDMSTVNQIFAVDVLESHLHVPVSSSTACASAEKEGDGGAHMRLLVSAFVLYLREVRIHCDALLLNYLNEFSRFYLHQPYGGTLLELVREIEHDKRVLEVVASHSHSPSPSRPWQGRQRECQEVHLIGKNVTYILHRQDPLIQDSLWLLSTLQCLHEDCSMILLPLAFSIPDSFRVFIEEYAKEPMSYQRLLAMKGQGIEYSRRNNDANGTAWTSLESVVQPFYVDFAMSLSAKETMQLIRIAKSIGLAPLQDLLTARIALLLRDQTKEQIRLNLGIPVSVDMTHSDDEEMPGFYVEL